MFNRGSFFAAHEALEDAWRSVPRGLPARRHLQGLVQVAVALHHESQNNFAGALSVLDRGVRNLAGAEESFPDLDLATLRADLAEWQWYLARPYNVRTHETRPALPQITRKKTSQEIFR